MTRKEIGPGWNRDNRNAMNDNFKELYTGMDTAAQKAIEEISDEFEAFKDKNDTHFKGVFATVAERDAAVTSPTHGDTATVADESTGFSTTYRYVDSTVDTSETETGWKERDRWKNATAINHLNQQLADKIARTEFDSWIASILDGGPSIFFDTYAGLVATYPKGSAGVALIRETDPARIYAWNGTKWEDFGPYQGVEVKDGSISITKLEPVLRTDISGLLATLTEENKMWVV